MSDQGTLLIRSRRTVLPGGVTEAAVFVRDGRVELIGGYDLRLDADRAVDLGDLPLLPGVQELLDVARDRGLRVGLATGNTRAILERRLGRHGVFGRFDAVVTRVEVERGKPHPDIYVEVARRLDVATDACLVLEDSVLGCEAALAAGMRVIACPSVVTAHLTFPAEAQRVASLVDVQL